MIRRVVWRLDLKLVRDLELRCLRYGTASRKAFAIAKPLLLTTLLVAGGFGLTKFLSRLVSHAKRERFRLLALQDILLVLILAPAGEAFYTSP
jgi:hypothetical protein